jgi:glycosyltransferase involved in cell wall biosynthesis
MHLVYTIDHIGNGGAQRQAVELAAHLRESEGWRVSFVVYREADFYGDRLRESGVPVIHVPKPYKYDPRLPRRMRRWLQSNPADVVHSFLPWSCMWGHLAVRGIGPAERPAFIAADRSTVSELRTLDRRVARFVYLRSDAVTANSQQSAEEIHRTFGVRRERIHYIPNGIDLERWDRASREEAPFVLEPGCFHLAVIGGLRPEKNHGLVVDALREVGLERIRNWRVWFIGHEPLGPQFADDLRRHVAESGLDGIVQIVPPTLRIAAVMRHLDGVLLPSSFEGSPNVVLEAMASGVPVVASRVGDVPNMAESGLTGLLLDRLNASELARAIMTLDEMGPSERAAMGGRARERVEKRYTLALAAARHRELYFSLRDLRSPNETAGNGTGST